MIARFLGGVQFLTIVPIHGRTAAPGQSALFFPLVGALLGLAGAALLLGLRTLLPAPIAAALVIGFWALLTGGLHEDGFADVADALRAGRSRDRMLAIMKDSRIGAHGALALILVVLVRWQALSSLRVDPIYALPAILASSRASLVLLAWISPPAGSGMAFHFSATLTSIIAIGALSQAIFLIFLAGSTPMLPLFLSLIVFVGKQYFGRRLGGVTGDCLGATCLTVESCGLVLAACPSCI